MDENMLRTLVRAALAEGEWEPLADWLTKSGDPRGKRLRYDVTSTEGDVAGQVIEMMASLPACPRCGKPGRTTLPRTEPVWCGMCHWYGPHSDLLPPLPL